MGSEMCIRDRYNNVLGFKKPNYTDDKRINQLKALYQFRNKTREEVQEHYYSTVKPKLLDGTKSEYHRRTARKRSNTIRNTRSKAVSIQLDEVLSFFKKNPKLESRVIEARKLGVQTLIDKMLQIFQHQEVENPNQILWI